MFKDYYREEYEDLETSDLKKIKEGLETRDAQGWQDRIACIHDILVERGNINFSHRDATKAREESHGDVAIAEKYSRKYRNAISRGISFELSFAEFKALLKEEKCFFTGMELTDDDSDARNKRTLDRINPDIGYTRENTVACSHAANHAKSLLLEEDAGRLSMSKSELLSFAKVIFSLDLGGRHEKRQGLAKISESKDKE